MLTKKEILKLLSLLELQVVRELRGVVIADRVKGYSEDPETGRLQAKLSIMLEAAGPGDE